ncbi:hypothetical protein Ahy_B01g056437 isoform A [Arachis hypogaea]|uniref:Uncharacterized protein n=1 Tax=Arachis hypogaea TaxID=3818 RepID=A0A445AZ02_ARAHY|nr:hypothetical protein Ahy_B01g056437 isoform A [Arachis hypogaea]
MSIRRTIENNEEASIRPSKTYQSFVAAAGGYRELNFIKKDVRNYITKEVRNGHAKIEQEMSQVVWNSHSKDSFDMNWNDFLLKYGLVDNKWLSDLYEDRHIWVPIYLDHYFWAGMRSTQRSESIYLFFNKFITRNSSLIQFVKQYDNCLGSKEQAERESNAVDFHTFQHVYTHQKFREVQAQFRGKANCITRLMNSALGYSVYEVGEQVSSSIFNIYGPSAYTLILEITYPLKHKINQNI